MSDQDGVGDAPVQARVDNLQDDIEFVVDSQANLLDGGGEITSEACLSFLAVTVATLAVTLAQVPAMLGFALQSEGSITHGSRLATQRRRRNFVCMTYICVMYQFLVLHNQMRNPRELGCEWYIKPRSKQWFTLFLITLPNVDPERFKQFFRISPDLFHHICEMLHDDLITDPPHTLRILPNRHLQVQRQVGIALCRLATGSTYLVVAELFGVSKATAVIATWKFVQALNRRAKHHLRWPDEAGLASVKARFEDRWGFPNCCGAVDGTHFPLELPPGENSIDYFDYKHNKSVSMQAILDLDMRFLDVVAGWPGSIQDTRLMRRSKFFSSVVFREDRLHGAPFVDVNGGRIREYILGDSGYPLYDWLITPFYPRGQSREQDQWNTRHSSARMCVERTFGRLKGCWRILSRILYKPKVNRIGPTIYACCLLHNMIINQQDGLHAAIYEGVRPHPNGYGDFVRANRAHFAGGPQARDRIMGEVMRRIA